MLGRPVPPSAGEGPAGDAEVRVRLCGGFAVEVGGERIEGRLRSRQARVLFALLIDRRARATSRPTLVDALWGDEPPPAWDAALRSLLSGVRRVFGADSVEGRGEVRLILPPGAWVDVEAAQDALTAGQEALAGGDPSAAREEAETAADLLEGELLPGCAAPWLDERRGELEDLGREALEVSGRAALANGDAEGAEHTARRLVERVPYRETAYELLMRALAARGNVAEASRVFDRLRRLLDEELGTLPSPGLIELHDRLLAGEEPLAAPGPGGWPGPRRTAWRGRVTGAVLATAGLALIASALARDDTQARGVPVVPVVPTGHETVLSGRGLALRYPDDWTLRSLPPPGVVGVGSGDAFCHVFRLPRPASSGQTGERLRAIATAEAARLRRTSPGAKTGPVALERAGGTPRATFTEHDRALGHRAAGRITVLAGTRHVLEVECSGPPATFPAFDARVFHPLSRSVATGSP